MTPKQNFIIFVLFFYFSKVDPTTNPVDDYEINDVFDNSPLFFQPGKPGYYSPRPGKNVIERVNCFRNVGRL